MLAVQVQYFNYLETQRHNVATERETERHDVTTENETMRHNIETEGQGRESLRISDFSAQTQRLAQEEQARHNLASETISVASLNETVRHNQEQEAIGRTQANASALSAQASMTSAQASMKSAQLNETKWNTSGYYLEQTERLKNVAQQQYFESQTTTGMMGAIGRLIGGVSGAIGTFVK